MTSATSHSKLSGCLCRNRLLKSKFEAFYWMILILSDDDDSSLLDQLKHFRVTYNIWSNEFIMLSYTWMKWIFSPRIETNWNHIFIKYISNSNCHVLINHPKCFFPYLSNQLTDFAQTISSQRKIWAIFIEKNRIILILEKIPPFEKYE